MRKAVIVSSLNINEHGYTANCIIFKFACVNKYIFLLISNTSYIVQGCQRMYRFELLISDTSYIVQGCQQINSFKFYLLNKLSFNTACCILHSKSFLVVFLTAKMKNFTLIDSIPGRSESQIHLTNQNLYFVSHNTLYNPRHVYNFESKILSYSVSSFIFVQTYDCITQLNKNGRVLSKLRIKKKVELFKTNNNFIYIFYTNVLDIFCVPYEYQRLMYNLKKRIILDSAVKCASIFDDLILISDEDNRVYILDYEKDEKYVLGSFVERIIDVYLVNDEITIVTCNSVYFYRICDEILEDLSESVTEDEISDKEDTKTAKKSYKRYFDQEKSLETKENGFNNKKHKKQIVIANDEGASMKKLRFQLVKKIKLEHIAASCFDGKCFYIAFMNDSCKMSISQITNKELSTDVENEYNEIFEISVCDDRIAMKGETEIRVLDKKTYTVLQKHVIDDIYTYAYYKNFYFTADKHGLRILNDKLNLVKEHEFTRQEHKAAKMKSIAKSEAISTEARNSDAIDTEPAQLTNRKFYKSTTRITNTFAKNNILLTISSLSTVKMYDYNNFYCFKSFQIPFNVICSETNDDCSLLFLANIQIYIYDTKRGKCIDELNYHSGSVIKMKCYDHFLYSLGVDNLLIKQDIYDTKKAHFVCENECNKTIVDFCIEKNVYLLKNNEVTIFDKELNLLKILSLKDDKKIVYERICVLNDSFVFCYGKCKERISEKEANNLILENKIKNQQKSRNRYYEKKDYIYEPTKTMPNVTEGKKDAKYTEKYYINVFSLEHASKVQEITLNEPVESMEIADNKLIIKNSNGIDFYLQVSHRFEPVELEIEATVDKVQEFIADKKYLYALVCAIKLNAQETIRNVLRQIDQEEIKMIVQNFPSKYVPKLREFLDGTENENWVKYIIFYHTKNGGSLNVNNIKRINNHAKINFYMLEAMKKRSMQRDK